MSNKEHTFCRICEPACPMIASLNAEQKVTRLEPDPSHPSGGIACHKGLSYLNIHNDPDRVNCPLHRTNSKFEAKGDFKRLSWDETFNAIGNHLRRLKDTFGPDSIAFYRGNPTAFDSRAFLAFQSLAQRTGSRMQFGSGTQDVTNKTRAAVDLYGSQTIMVPDIENTQYLLCIGANPRVSHWTAASVPNDALQTLKKIKRRGGTVTFVNPRRIESSTPETGETLRIKPGSDVYFLAAMVNEIFARNQWDKTAAENYGRSVDALRKFVERYPAIKVEKVTGIPAETIKKTALDFANAESAVAYMSTGVNQSRQGMLCFWLSEMLNFITGNLGRKGGSFAPRGFYSHKKRESLGLGQVIETSIGPVPGPAGYISMPAVLMPDLMKAGDIKALICLSGNPLLSVGGEARMREGLQNLELLICLDIQRNATAELADFVLPSADFLERADINFLSNGFQSGQPYVQYSDAIVEPAHERRADWWIVEKLAQEMGLESVLDKNVDSDGFELIERLLSASGLSIGELKSSPHRTALLPRESQSALFERCLKHDDGKVDCFPGVFVEAGLIAMCDRIFDELSSEDERGLKLISLRTHYMHNSWLANTERFRKGAFAENALHMCEEDAQARGLLDGDRVSIRNNHGQIETVLQINDDLRPGAVALSHGYGNAHTYGLKRAQKIPGANCNALMPIGVQSYEPLSHMSWLSAVPVEVTSATA